MLAFDLCCGTGGWTDALLALGYQVIGVDIHRDRRYRGELLLMDVRDLPRLPPCQLIVASPPCNEFSLARIPRVSHPDLSIVRACFRLGAGLPFVLENVHGLQRFLGPAAHHYGRFYLWGDVPALLPQGPPWKARSKTLHRSPALRARIPYELADAVGRFYLRQAAHSSLLGTP